MFSVMLVICFCIICSFVSGVFWIWCVVMCVSVLLSVWWVKFSVVVVIVEWKMFRMDMVILKFFFGLLIRFDFLM